MHQARLMLPLQLQSFGGVTRVWPFGELRIPLLHAFPAPSHLPQSKYDTQMTQILLEEYIFIAGAMKDKRDLQKKRQRIALFSRLEIQHPRKVHF